MTNYCSIQHVGWKNVIFICLKKIPLRMKLSVVLLFISMGLACATESYSQNTLLTLDISNKPVQEVLDIIEDQTEFHFFYNNKQVDTSREVSVKSRGENVFSVLNQIFEDTDISYKVLDKSIILSHKELIASAIVQQSILNISGTITDAYNEPVIGANVFQKGSTNGTVTDVNGHFNLNIPAHSTLVISYIGYISQEIAVGNNTVFNIILIEDSKNLEEVVVTALGIKREEKALGYAVQKIKSEELVSAKGIDVATALTGKIAGLNVKNSTEFNETATLKLRGENPLIIIDGIPYGNMSINNVAADDIESLSVLKGATASALYGSRGATGAIMITTKKGATQKGLNIDINSNTMFFSGFLAFPQTQSEYSRGYGGKYGNDYVWGDKLDIGRTAVLWDPYENEWREQELVSKGKNNFKNFLQTSWVTNNNISVTQQGEFGSFRASFTQGYNRGQYPNQDLNKFTFFVGGEMKYGKFSMEAAASYNKRISSNDHGSGYTGSYIYDMVIWGGAEYDVREYKDYWVKGKEHIQQNWYDGSWYDNPWFKAWEVVDPYDNDKLNAYANLTFEFNPWLKAMARAGLDFYSNKNEWRNAPSANSAWDKKGFYGISRSSGYSLNTDAMLMADKTWGKLNVNALVGGNVYYYMDDFLRITTAGGLTIPGFYSLKASVDPVSGSKTLSEKRVNSLYGKLSLSWNNTYFLDVTGRNDWSSTLPAATRSYFYPSVAGSIVLSEIIPLPDVWDFWKIRGSWTSTKADMGVYATNNAYSVSTNVWDGYATASYPGNVIGGNVSPKTSTVLELGTAVNFFKNRLFADFAYFRKKESNFIINGGISPSTGFSGIQTNFKEERLRDGLELTIGGSPIRNNTFKWDVLVNLGKDKYSYSKLDPEYSTKKPWVKEGESWDWFAIYDWDRDPEGNIIHNGGIPVKQSFTSKVGNLTPDLVWGITNTFKYKQFGLSFTIDGRIGGKSYSRTHQMLWNTGAHEKSVTQWRYDEVVNGKTTYVGEGVKVVSGSVERDPDGNILSDTRVFAPNDVPVSYEAYISKYHDSNNKPSWQNVLDETFFKVRNLTFSYDLPTSFCQKLSMKNATLSLTGQNLFLWAKEYKYADPDKGGNSSGHENLNSPSQRYVGVNIKVNF